MKDNDYELHRLSMDDGDDDYDEYEEEVIERDEEYEPEDGEYEDEEPYDEEYEEEPEEYEEEEPYDEEPYDEGYDDQYYDDRLNKVLDELAELKRGMSAPAIAQPQPQPQQHVYSQPQAPIVVPVPQNSGNEVVMYNEISRLRDELSKTQNSQSLHVELSRLKEDMEKDKRQNESVFLSEIKRLNEKIENLQKENEKAAHASAAPGAAIAAPASAPAGYLPESSISTDDFNRLIGINEAILRSSRDTDSRIIGDINAVKAKLDELPPIDELTKSIAALRKTVKAIDDRTAELDKIGAQIDALKKNLTDSGVSADSADKLIGKLRGLAVSGGGSADITALTGLVYELKAAIGSADENEIGRIDAALKAYGDFAALKASVSGGEFKQKLYALDNFVKSNASAGVPADIADSFSALAAKVTGEPLTRESFDSVIAFSASTGSVTVPLPKRDEINMYLTLADRAQREDITGIIDFLPDLENSANVLTAHARSAQNAEVVTEIMSANADLMLEADPAKAKGIANKMRAQIAQLCSVTVGEAIGYAPSVQVTQSQEALSSAGQSLFELVSQLKDVLSGASRAEVDLTPVTSDLNLLKQQLASLSLKLNSGTVTPSEDGSQAVTSGLEIFYQDVKDDYARVLEKLDALTEAKTQEEVEKTDDDEQANPVIDKLEDVRAELIKTVQEETAVTSTTCESNVIERLESLIDPEIRNNIVEDLHEISVKLADYDVFISQISDLRAEVLGLTPPDFTAQFDKLYEDIAAQIDKLYEDVAAVNSDALNTTNAKIDDVAGAVDEAAAKLDTVVDSVARLTDADVSSTVLDTLVDLRAAYEETQAAAGEDRGKILEDVAFIRSQFDTDEEKVENADIYQEITELKTQMGDTKEYYESQNTRVLDEITSMREALDDSMANRPTADQETVIIDALTDVSGKTLEISDKAQSIEDYAIAISERTHEIADKAQAIEDSVSANSIVTLENQNTILDELDRIRLQVSPTAEEGQDAPLLADMLADLADKVEQFNAQYSQRSDQAIAELAEIKEQIHLKELEQGLTAVAASEEEQQTLLKEISQLRERTASLEQSYKEQSDAQAAQISLVTDQLLDLRNSLPADKSDELAAVLDEIRTKLTADVEPDFAKIQDDLTFIRGQIEANMEPAADGTEFAETLSDEDITLILDDLAAIKEKLNSLDEYDTVAEILSLREDVKASRVVDSTEVTTELESLKGDILELKAELSEIKILKTEYSENELPEGGVAAQPSSDEMNMLLNEIVSMRDELQAYKDDINNLMSGERSEPAETVISKEDENITAILDELTALHSEISGYKEETTESQAAEIASLKESVAEIKDLIARRTSLVETTSEQAASNELNVVLDEIIDLKNEIGEIRQQMSEKPSEEPTDGKAEIIDELSAFKDEITAYFDAKLQELSSAQPDFSEDLQVVKNQLADIQVNQAMSNLPQDEQPAANVYDEIMAELQSIRQQLEQPQVAPVEADTTVYDEIQALRQDIEGYRMASVQTVAEDGTVATVDLSPIQSELSELRQQLMAVTVAPETQDAELTVLSEVMALRDELAAMKEQLAAPVQTESEPDVTVLNEILALRDELAAMKEQLAAPVQTESEPDVTVLSEILALRDELAAMKEQLAAPVQTESEPDVTVLNEILALRDELAAMKEQSDEKNDNIVMDELARIREQLAAQTDTTVLGEVLALRDEMDDFKLSVSQAVNENDMLSTIDSMRSDIKSLKDEPDLSVINEVLALRDEFQAFKDEMNKTRTGSEDKTKEELIAQVQQLRDQMFAISMANVNDGTGSDVVYESYNNIILDEITALRDELGLIKQSDTTKALADEMTELKQRVANMAVDEKENLEAQFSRLKAEIDALKQREDADATNNAILLALDNLKQELSNQRDADATTLNFMSEMAHLLERQNLYITQSSNNKLAGEIESLKAEIATSLSAQPSIMDEISKLKEELSQGIGEPVIIDNQAILDELSKLKDEIARDNPGRENNLVLQEISRLKDEISAIIEKEHDETGDADLSRSISDLKAELSSISDMVSDEQPPKKRPAAKTSKAAAKTGAKTASKKRTAAKPKPEASEIDETAATAFDVDEVVLPDSDDGLSGDELLSKIEATSIEIPRTTVGQGLALDPNAPKMTTSDEMDIASKLAKQVANKLIMEQLVQQLGDGGVPRGKVEEIVKDILPTEFSTVQMDEQTDQVRRLANSLVLDKLRARLSNKKDR